MEEQVGQLIATVKECASSIIGELGPGWQENIYQKAMETALRDKGIMYETQRILPITYNGHVIGESIPDLVVWLKNDGRKTAVIVELKSDSAIKEEFPVQVKRYIQELRKQVRENEEVWSTGILINFIKEANSKKMEDGFEEFNGVQALEVMVQ